MNRGVKAIFWGAEIAFALVSGISEVIIYQAYSVNDWAGTVQAFMRAGGMQLMIVMFGFAAVQAAKHKRGSMVVLANALALIFSFISFWLIRESALAEAHLSFLQAAYTHPISIFGLTISGQDLDPTLIGCLPFLQTAVNWFAPIITSDMKVEYTETQAESEERYKRELAEAQFKQELRAIKAAGTGNVARAAVRGAIGKKDEPTVAPPTQPQPGLDTGKREAVAEAERVFAQNGNGHGPAVDVSNSVMMAQGNGGTPQARMAPQSGVAVEDTPIEDDEPPGPPQGTQKPTRSKARPTPGTPAFNKAVYNAAKQLQKGGVRLSYYNIAQEMQLDDPKLVEDAILALKNERRDNLKPGQELKPDPILDTF